MRFSKSFRKLPFAFIYFYQMKKKLCFVLFTIAFFLSPQLMWCRETKYINHYITLGDSTKIKKTSLDNVAPYLIATGNQIYCPSSSIKIVTNMTITDPDDSGIDAIYIQISSGYILGQDTLTLTGIHPTITSSWDSVTGILSLTGVAGQPTYVDLISAIEDVEYASNSPNPSGTRNFSISVGQANYLPSNGHYYLFIPNLGIKWSDAKIAAQNSTYYGLQGYLATLTSTEESQIAGEQTTGAGWIGGSDEVTEGVWKWMTGPEIGTVFWNGAANGSTPNYAFWNTGEPNNLGNENYAHVTAPGVGITGSWNDLSDTGAASGDYQPKGYIIEYGGMPGDPVLHISTSTTLSIPTINQPIGNKQICESNTVTLNATANNGTISWFDNAIGGLPLAVGNTFTTPILTDTTIYYLDVAPVGCTTYIRIPLTVTVIQQPTIVVATLPYLICQNTSAVLSASPSSGIVNWFSSATSTTSIATGLNYTTPALTTNTIYYVEANNSGCTSSRTNISVTVNPAPILSNDEFIQLCEETTTPLDAGISGQIYLWSTGQTSQVIQSNGQTNYSVTVTSPAPASCSSIKNYTLAYHSKPTISDISVIDSHVTINTINSGDFEYSINGQNFQSSNIFTVTEGGLYTGYVREKNNCGIDHKPFVVLSIPEFFSPNGDGVNDIWFIKGITNFTHSEVQIFDRFGWDIRRQTFIS